MTRLLARHTAICPIFYKFWGVGALTFSTAETECAQANPKNRLCTAGPFVNGPYGVHVGCLLNKPDTQIIEFNPVAGVR